MTFSIKELLALGIKLPNNPKNIIVSKKASLYNPHLMSFSSNIRIDDFAILSGRIDISSFVHIGAYVALYAGSIDDKEMGIEIGEFCTISPKATIFATSDDFSGEYLISPLVDSKYCNVKSKKVLLKEHVQICSNAIIMPGVTCEIGSVLGAMSLLKDNAKSFSIYAGIPARKIKSRSKIMLDKKKEFLANSSMGGGSRYLNNIPLQTLTNYTNTKYHIQLSNHLILRSKHERSA